MSSSLATIKMGWLRFVAVLSIALTLVVLASAMVSPYGKELAMPGPLRSFHAPLRNDCDRCHEASASAIQSVVSGLASTELSRVQNRKCLSCHEQWKAPEHPHDWSDEGPDEFTVATDCATCHQEHEGRNESLRFLTDAQCQSCHAEPFESFEDGHPEFTSHFTRSGTSIVFDHVQHLQSHLPERGAVGADSCNGCHMLDVAGERMLTRPFAESCAPCHADEILGSKQVSGRGLTLLGIPALDLMTLEDSGVELGAWPADAEFGESPLSPLMSLLIAADEEARSDLAAYRELDPKDLTGAEEASLQVVQRVAWRIKQICAELVQGGQATLTARLERLAGEDLPDELVAHLCGGLSLEMATAAVDEWFPELERELAERTAGQTLSARAPLDPSFDHELEAAREEWVLRGGWYRQSMDPALRYRPRGHDDAFMRTWIEFASQLAEDPKLPEARQVMAEIFAEEAVGVCAKCHVRPEAGEPFVWRVTPGWFGERGVTRFNHATHYPILDDRACATCHELAAEGGPSEFEPLERATCLECHGEEAASSACTTCHTYHSRQTPFSESHSGLSLLPALRSPR